MGMIKLATAVLILIAAPAFADSLIEYELQLGGDNHASDIKAGVRTEYTPGSPDDAQSFAPGVLNWATDIEVSGIHSQPGHDSDGLATQGVANFVFDLELREGSATGPLVSTADFYSSIHDGTGALTCAPGGRGWMIGHSLPSQAEFCAGSAYAFSYDIANIGWGYGRVIEALDAGDYTGPFMEVGLYPTVDADNGRILGTGAGYGQWSRFGGYGTMTSKGVGLPGPYPDGLGIVPVVEGQIDTSQLAPGTYVLVLVEGTGHNVLRGDVELENEDAPAFAVPANDVNGDTITFTIASAALPPVVSTAMSYKDHGTAGEIGIDVLDRMEDADIECRNDGVTKLVVVFDMDIQRLNGDVTDVEISSGGPNPDTVTLSASNELTIEMSGTTNAVPLIVDFPGIANASEAGAVCEDSVCIRQLVGDARADKSVNVGDRIDVRNQGGLEVTVDNFRCDVRADGTFNVGDRIDVRNAGGTGFVGTCPE